MTSQNHTSKKEDKITAIIIYRLELMSSEDLKVFYSEAAYEELLGRDILEINEIYKEICTKDTE